MTVTVTVMSKPKPAPPPPKFLNHRRVEGMPGEPKWHEVVDKVGYPKPIVVVDFETYFDDVISMGKSKLSTIEYVKHPGFEVLGVSVLRMDAADPDQPHEGRVTWYNGEGEAVSAMSQLQEDFGLNLERCTVVAQNALFDGTILSSHYGIHPPYVIDTLGLARHWDARAKNDLATLCKRFGLVDKGDTSEFSGWTNKLRFTKNKSRKRGPKLPLQRPRMTAEDQDKLAAYANNDVLREWEVFTTLLPKLSTPEVELRIMNHTLNLFWKPSLLVDYEKAEELITLMEAEIDKAVEAASDAWREENPHRPPLERSSFKGDAFEDLLEEALNEFDPWSDDPLDGFIKPAKNKKGWKFAIAKEDEAREALLGHTCPRVRTLMQASVALSSWPLHTARIRRIVSQSRASGGTLPVPLKYHGAHTGRWSGGEGINLQNLGSRGHQLVNAIRELLRAPCGKELVIADASQIEARVLAWIAGQWDLVSKFANNEEIYCGFASRVLGYPVRKARKGDIPAIAARLTWARNSIGKVGVLGCGYGMGEGRVVEYAKGEVTPDIAKKIVDTYRQDNDKIVTFWHELEAAFIYVARYQTQVSMARGLNLYPRPGCDVVIQLPSGRELKYHQVRVEQRWGSPSVSVLNPITRSWDRTWGGSLTENVVQAMSRDILWGAIAKMEDAGYPVVHHVHDELIAMVPEGEGADALAFALKSLNERPSWGADLPLGSEGTVTARYGGH